MRDCLVAQLPMTRLMTLQEMFKRYRRPGDVVFALVFLAFSLFLLLNLKSQLVWKDGLILGKQPALWPTIAVIGMACLAFLHWLSSALSPRIYGRFAEMTFWAKSCEYVLWFMAYIYGVKYYGYLPMTIVLAVVLGIRVGFRSWRSVMMLILFAVVVVVVFKSMLQVNIPGGALYDYLPGAVRSFALTYL